MATLGTRLDRLEATMSEPKYHAEAEAIREKIKQKIPRLIKSADAGDNHSLRLLASYLSDLESRLVEMSEAGSTEARDTLGRLYKARAERATLA